MPISIISLLFQITSLFAQNPSINYLDYPHLVIAAKNSTADEKKVADFVCDGVSDQEQINAAFKKKRLVKLQSGTFNIDKTIIGGNNILIGEGQNTIIQMIGGLNEGIILGGSQTLLEYTTTVFSGSTQMTTKNDQSYRLAAGDIVSLMSKDVFNGLRGYYWNGEMLTVKSVSGKKVTFNSPVKWDYKTEKRLVKYNFANGAGIADLKIINGTAKSIICNLHETINGFYKNVHLEGKLIARQGLKTSHSYNFTYENCTVNEVMDSNASSTPHGYGYYLFGVVNSKILNCKGNKNKHSVELGGYQYVPITEQIEVRNFLATDDRLESFSTHGAAYDNYWYDCEVKNSGGGFLIRSPKNLIVRPIIKTSKRCGYAMRFGEYTQQNGTWNKYDGSGGDDLIIEDAVVELTGDGARRMVYFTDPINNVKITGGVFKGNIEEAIYSNGLECKNLEISNCLFDISNQAAEGTIIKLEPMASTTSISGSLNDLSFCGYKNQKIYTNTKSGELKIGKITYDCKQPNQVEPISDPTISIIEGKNEMCPGEKAIIEAPIGFSSYKWSNGATTRQIEVGVSGDYSVIVTNDIGQTSNSSNIINIKINPAPGKQSVEIIGKLEFCQGEKVTLNAPDGFSEYLWNDNFKVKSREVLNSGSFQVKVRNASGCWSPLSDPVETKEQDLPPVPKVSNDLGFIICYGDSTKLSAPDGYVEYLWNDGTKDAVKIVTEVGLYSVQVKNSSSCWSDKSETIEIIAGNKSSVPKIVSSGDNKLCPGDSIRLSAPSGFNKYLWSDGTTKAFKMVSEAGLYSVQVKNSGDCWSDKSETTEIIQVNKSSVPTIVANEDTNLCPGDSIRLSVSGGFNNYLWSDGTTEAFKMVSEAGLYSVQVKNSGECWSDKSETTEIVIVNKPSEPVIISNGDSKLCPGDSIRLSAPSGFNKYLWSDGTTEAFKIVTEEGSYSVQVNNSGDCWSDRSQPIDIIETAKPPVPSITSNEGFKLCPGETLVLSAPSGYNSYLWSDGSVEKELTVKETGKYHVKVKDSNNCWSNQSYSTSISIGTVPEKPAILGDKDVIICEGDRVMLETNVTADEYLWTNGVSNQTNEVYVNGTYSLKYKMDGSCWSESAEGITVKVNQLPKQPVLNVSGIVELCLGSKLEIKHQMDEALHWSNGITSNAININNEGKYSAVMIDSSGCVSPPSDEVIVSFKDINFTPQVIRSSDKVLCEDESIELTVVGDYIAYKWNTGEESKSIIVSEPGHYEVKVNVCEDHWSYYSIPSIVEQIALPEKPTVETTGDTLFTYVDAEQYELYLNDELLSQSINPFFVVKSSGTYKIAASNENCAIFSDEYYYENITGDFLSIYPNPNNGSFNLEIINPTTSLYDVKVYNTVNNVVYHEIIEENITNDLSTYIDLNDLKSGLYIVRVSFDNKTRSEKLIVR